MGLIFELAPWLIVAVGTWALVRGILGIVEKRKLVIGDGEVSVTGTNMFRRESWSEPLSAYQGIRWREIVIYRGSATGSSSGTTSDRAKYFQVLEIVHPDRGKTVPLLVTRRHDGVRGDWERLAKLIGVPAIDARGGSATVRAAEDVDKSIKELASEGKIDAEWKEGPVPRGLEIAYLGEVDDPDNQSIQVTFWTPRYPVWLYGAVSLFGGFFVVLGISDGALLPIILGGGLIYGVIWHYRSEMANPRTLTITRSALQIETPSPGNPGNSENVPHRAIESVEITVRQDRQIIGERLAIATDRQE